MLKKIGSAFGRISSAAPPSGGAGLSRSSITMYLIGTSLTPPLGAKFMRVAAIGPGGDGGAASTTGGGGGGCAATKIVPASAITFSIGVSGRGTGTPTTASFNGYNLVGGAGGTGSPESGGVGSGGDFNFAGGTASSSGRSGGGAAGPAGPGRASPSSSTVSDAAALTNNGWSIGGGGAGGYTSFGDGYGGGSPGSPGNTSNGDAVGTSAGRTVAGLNESDGASLG
jgi:hypothetical protein